MAVPKTSAYGSGRCRECFVKVAMRADGTLWTHPPGRVRVVGGAICDGSRQPPGQPVRAIRQNPR